MIIFNTISEQEKIDFAKSLSVMLRSGIPLNDALESFCAQGLSKSFTKIIKKIKLDVEYGSPLSSAMAKHKNVFSQIFISLVKIGEAGGTLEDNLVFVADWMEKNNELRQEINAATFYPKFVVLAAIGIGFALSVYVLPKLVPLFNDLKIELPLSTRIMMSISMFVQQYWLISIFLLIGLLFSGWFLNKTLFVKIIKDWLSLRAPIVKPIAINYNMAILCQILSVLLKGGLSINEAIATAKDSLNNIYYQKSLEQAQRSVARGTSVGQALTKYRELYPRNFLSIVIMGETSGSLEASLSYLTDYYTRETQNRTKKLPAIIEPLLLVIIALGVVFIAISVVMPIYSLTSGLSK